MMTQCTWPSGTCACLAAEAEKLEDYAGRVWMHCEEGLAFTKASMARFMMFCLANRIEIGDVYAFNPSFARCQVSASIRIRPDQFAAFEAETGGKLRKPPVIRVSTGNRGAQS